MEENGNKISFKNELIRKSIHLSSSVIPVAYIFLSRELAILILGISSLLLVLIDILRKYNEPFRNLYHGFLKPILRHHEVQYDRHVFTGGTYIVISFFLCVLFFPKPVAISSMFIVIFCDSFAAIVGKNYGRHFLSNKTFEGSAAFFITGVIIILLTPKVTASITEYYIGFSAVFLSAIFELLPVKIDDNISMPIFFGLVYMSLLKIFL